MKPSIVVKLSALKGDRTTSKAQAMITDAIPWTPSWLLDLMAEYPLANATFSLDDHDDMSGLGVEMKWLSAEDILDEAVNAYPGIAAARYRYIPVGECLLGTGDPYFVKADAEPSPIYRIPHGAVRGDDLELLQIEVVSPSVEAFFELALAT